MMTDWPARVFDHIDGDVDAMIDFLADLVRIPSVTGSDAEHEAQAWLAARLHDEGLEIDHWQIPLADLLSAPDFPGVEAPRTAAWGLVGRLPGRSGGRSLMFNGHVDVVPPGDLNAWSTRDPFSGRIRGEFVYGRGACDMKGGLVAAIFAVRALRRARVPLRGDVILACVQSEEDGGLGTFATLRRGWRADACVIAEPTSLDIVPANGGALTFRLRVHGLAAHASRRTEGVSAIEKLWPIFQALRSLERHRNTDVDPLMRRWDIAYPIEIGTVRAGDWPSSVPDSLVAEGRFGVMLDEPVGAARRALEDAVAEACAADPWLREHPVSVEWWGGQFASGRLRAEDRDLLERMRRAHAATCGRTPDVYGAPYGSDLRLLTGIGDIPTLQYGPGDVKLAHATDERVSIPDVITAARALALLALDHCGIL